MIQLRSFVATVFAVAVLPAFAGGMDSNCSQSHSRAWCVLDATNISAGTVDVPLSRLTEAGKNGDQKDAGYGAFFLALNQVGHYLQPSDIVSFGASNIVHATEMLLGLMAPDSAFEKGDYIIGWVPSNLAKSPEDAVEQLEKPLFDYIEHSMFPGSRMKVQLIASKDGPERNLAVPMLLTFEGGVCAKIKCQVAVLSPYKVGSLKRIPSWAGIDATEGYYMNYGTPLPRIRINGKDMTYKFAIGMSKALPNWAYVEVGKEKERANGYVTNVGSKVPFIAHQGKALLPVFPEFEPKTVDSSRTTGQKVDDASK